MLYAKSTEAAQFSAKFSLGECERYLRVGRELSIEQGRFTSSDKGYCDFNWWSEIGPSGCSVCFFLTRFRKLRLLKVEQSLPSCCRFGGPI